MPFKKQSPGCRCCASTVVVHHNSANTYAILGAVGGLATASINLSTEVGETADIIGIDLERKYILYRRVSNDEVWLYDPFTTSAVSKLWDPCDASDDPSSDITGRMIWYIHSWGLSYGVLHRVFGPSSEERYAFSLDANGNYLNGPYAQTPSAGLDYWGLENLAMTDNGDIYLRSNGSEFLATVSGLSRFRIFKNGDMAHPRSTATITCPDPVAQSSPSVQIYYTPGYIFSDGTNLYIQLSLDGASHPSLARGIYSIDLATGDLTFIFDDVDMMPESDQLFRGLVYNPTEGRFEGMIDIVPGSVITRLGIWTAFDEEKHLTFPATNSGVLGEPRTASYIPLTPPNIEEVWDAL